MRTCGMLKAVPGMYQEPWTSIKVTTHAQGSLRLRVTHTSRWEATLHIHLLATHLPSGLPCGVRPGSHSSGKGPLPLMAPRPPRSVRTRALGPPAAQAPPAISCFAPAHYLPPYF